MKGNGHKAPATTPPLPKCPTGIVGLDEITSGGLPRGRPNPPCGPPARIEPSRECPAGEPPAGRPASRRRYAAAYFLTDLRRAGVCSLFHALSSTRSASGACVGAG